PPGKDRRLLERLQRRADSAGCHAQVVDAFGIFALAHDGEAMMQAAQLAPDSVHAHSAQRRMAVEPAILAQEGKAALELAERLWLQWQLLLEPTTERFQVIAHAIAFQFDLELMDARGPTAGADDALVQHHLANHAIYVLDLPFTALHVQPHQWHERAVRHHRADPVGNFTWP